MKGDLGTKRRKRKKSVKTEEIFEICVSTVNVEGWVQMSTYKGEAILQAIVTTIYSE